jgi:hypothetical protein
MQLTYEIARERQADLRRAAKRHGQARPATPRRVVIRLAADSDGPALHRLAALEGVDLRAGSWLCAEADGALTAALRLEDGTVLADPFARTRVLTRLLQVWAAQAGGRSRRRWRPAVS